MIWVTGEYETKTKTKLKLVWIQSVNLVSKITV